MALPQKFPCLLSSCPARPSDWQPALTCPSHSSSWRLGLSSCLMPFLRVTSTSQRCLCLSLCRPFPELSEHPDGLRCNLHLENSRVKISFGNSTVNMSLHWVIWQSSPCSNAYAPGAWSLPVNWESHTGLGWICDGIKGKEKVQRGEVDKWEMFLKGVGEGLGQVCMHGGGQRRAKPNLLYCTILPWAGPRAATDFHSALVMLATCPSH